MHYVSKLWVITSLRIIAHLVFQLDKFVAKSFTQNSPINEWASCVRDPGRSHSRVKLRFWLFLIESPSPSITRDIGWSYRFHYRRSDRRDLPVSVYWFLQSPPRTSRAGSKEHPQQNQTYHSAKTEKYVQLHSCVFLDLVWSYFSAFDVVPSLRCLQKGADQQIESELECRNIGSYEKLKSQKDPLCHGEQRHNIFSVTMIILITLERQQQGGLCSYLSFAAVYRPRLWQ